MALSRFRMGLGLAVLAMVGLMGVAQGGSPTAQDQKTLKFEFDYSEADPNLFNDVLKEQIEGAGAFLASYIADSGTIQIKVIAKADQEAYAMASTNEWATNEDNKVMPKTGTITIQQKSAEEASQKKTNLFALIVHELGHVLGFTEACKAYASREKNGMFSGDHVTKFNGGPAPMDGGHFDPGFRDKAGLSPRMRDGGGGTLSVLDLAVLADLGYSVPLLDQLTECKLLPFKLPQAAANFDSEDPNARYFQGTEGDDTLVAGKGKWTLSAGPGDDILVSGEGETTMYGRLQPGAPGKDTFYIRTAAGKHTINNFDDTDVICLDPEFKIEDIEAFLKDPEKVQQAKNANGQNLRGKYILKLSDDVQVTVGHQRFKPLSASNFKIEAYQDK